MSNEYYNSGGVPSQGGSLTSASLRAEHAAIQSGFEKLPILSGNSGKVLRINGAETGIDADVNSASLVINVPAGNLTSTTVQDAINELDSEKQPVGSYQAASANLDEYAAVNPTAAGLALLDDADAAAQRATLGISAANTSNTPAGTITATDVQGALNELASEKPQNDGTGATGIWGINISGNAATATTATTATTALAGPNNSPFSFRNKIINGDMRIAQLGTVAIVNNSLAYGGADMIGVAPVGFTTATGTVAQGNFASLSGFSQVVDTTTTGAGVVQFVHRMELLNTRPLNGKQVTVSAKFYHNVGSALNCGFVLSKAGSADNFTSPVVIATGATTSVASATTTTIATTFTLGATDATNGLQIMGVFNGVGAVTSKLFAMADWQLEEGSVATPFETRPIGTELALCQRYCEVGNFDWTMYQAAGAGYSARQPFMVEKRATPTITVSGTGVINTTSPGVSATTRGIYQTGTATTLGVVRYSGDFLAVARL